MRPQDVVKDAKNKIHIIITTKITNHAQSRRNVRIAACDEAKTQVGEQVERVRAVLQPGVTVSRTIIAADQFVVNSTKNWPDWEKVTRPDDEDLVDHPWYRLYFKRCVNGDSHLSGAIKVKAMSGDKGSGGSRKVEVERQSKDSKVFTSQPARRSLIATTAQPPTVVVPTAISSDSSCVACIDRGVACDPQPGRRCLQCKTRRHKCSHSIRAKRTRSVSRSPPVIKRARTRACERATRDLWVNPMESYVRADPPAPSHLPSPTQLVLSRDVAMDATPVSREDFNSLVRKHDALAERVSTIEDAVLSWARAVESTR
ncbi:hypothetical protein J3R83DRAFT_13301 [Lanmaoa asiatica]|nr:hypothetical protein J3R83DRAFT_13301 [Lanmaoa asiatica]